MPGLGGKMVEFDHFAGGLWSGFVIPAFGPQAIEPSCGQGLQFLFWTTGRRAILWSGPPILVLDHRPPRRPVVSGRNSDIYTASGAENRQIADKIADKIKDSTASFLKGKQPNPYFKPGRCSLFGWMLEITSDFFL